MLVIVPVVGIVGVQSEVGVPYPLIVSLLLGMAVYALLVFRTGDWVPGSMATIVVFATLRANVPIVDAATWYPGDVVGSVLLLYPAVALFVLGCWYRGVRLLVDNWPTRLYAAFVGWTVVSAVLSNGPASMAALWFSVYVAIGFVVFVTVQTVVRAGWIRFRAVLLSLTTAIFGHTVVALAQISATGAFGLSRLGEGGDITVASLSIGVTSLPVGTFVSGFTGMSFNLANLLVFAVPIALVSLFRARGTRRQLLWASGVVLGCFVLRATTTDAGRGGLLVALFTLFVLLLYSSGRIRACATVGHSRLRRLSTGAVVGLGVLATLVPSSATSSESVREVSLVETGGGSTLSGTSPVGSAGQQALDWLTTSSIPLFDLSNLGIRMQQYLVGFQLFTQHPIAGLGGMNYVAVASTVDISQPAHYSAPLPIHSVFVTLLVETGIVGCTLYVATLCVLLVQGVRLLSVDDADRLFVLAAIGGIVGSIAFSFWDVLQLYYGTGFFPLWIVAGAIVGKYDRFSRAPIR